MELERALTGLALQRRDRKAEGKFQEAAEIGLGIEALKAWRDRRLYPSKLPFMLLPGETTGMPTSLTDPSIKLGQPGKEK